VSTVYTAETQSAETQTDRDTDMERQTDTQTHRQTDRQTHRQTERQRDHLRRASTVYTAETQSAGASTSTKKYGSIKRGVAYTHTHHTRH